MFIFDYISIVIAIGSIFWAAYLFFGIKSKEARYLSLFVFFTALWSLGIAITDLSTKKILVEKFTIICTVLGLLAIFSFMLFVFVFRFPDRKIIKGNFLFIILVAGFIAYVLFVPSGKLVYDIKINYDSPPSGRMIAFLSYYYVFLIVTILIRSLYILFRGYKILGNRKRAQIKYVSLGGLISIFLATVFDAILPYVFMDERFYSLGPLSFIIFVVFTSYAIIKYKLFDIKIIIQRGIIYSIILGIVSATYLLFIFLLGDLFQQSTRATSLLAGGLVAILGIYGVPVIDRHMRRLTDPIFFKDKYDYSKVLFSISEILNDNVELEQILRGISRLLKGTFKIKSVRVFFPEEGKVFDEYEVFRPTVEKIPADIISCIEKKSISAVTMADLLYMGVQASKNNDKKLRRTLQKCEYFCTKYDIEVFAPIILKQKLIGFITLPKKKSGDHYTGDDLSLIKTMTNHAAVALERARLFARVKNYSRELEKRVEERTAEIKGLQEEQKQMMLEMAHGLQTPLTIIKAELSSLATGKKNEKIVSVERSIDRISKFIYDMLRLARLDSGKDELTTARFNLSETLLDLAESVEIVNQGTNIAFSHDIQPDIHITGIKSEIEEMVMNLVSNSMKYIGNKGDQRITVNCRADDRTILLTVEDTGIGIKEEHLPNLFSKFYRIKDSNESKIKGTGLGLVICKKIVEKHGGRISVDSEPGRGTKFTIQLKRS